MSEEGLIKAVVQQYIDGAITGNSDTMKPAFYVDAHVFGYIGDDLFAAPIQSLYDWNTETGPATELQASISSINIVGSIASVELDLKNWNGADFTDIFSLLKVDGEWKITNKVFHTHT